MAARLESARLQPGQRHGLNAVARAARLCTLRRDGFRLIGCIRIAEQSGKPSSKRRGFR
jgi:hypothetical protein